MIGRNLDDENFKKIQKFVKKNRINQRKIEENSQKKIVKLEKIREKAIIQRKSYHSEKIQREFRQNSEKNSTKPHYSN